MDAHPTPAHAIPDAFVDALAPPAPARYSTLSPSLQDTSAHSSFPGTPASNLSRPLLPTGDSHAPFAKFEAEASPFPDPKVPLPSRNRRQHFMLFGAGATIAIVVIVLVIVLPVTLVHKHHRTSSVTGTALPTSNPESPTGATSGGNGSIISTADNVTFTYINSFGGYWVYDPANPYNNSARAQSWSPALDEEWDYSTNRIQGVNLGGWLVLEPFIVPALFEKYQNETPSNALPGGNVVDEWTLSIAMLNDTSPGGGIQQIEEHYATFITEQDFAQIAGAGLNWIRLPIPYWAIEAWPGEPFLAKAAWKYVLLAFQWARKYGLRVLLDLHTIPGSQNGLNHSGRAGTINFLNGPMGIANADRALGYIRILTEFITQEQYVNVVPMWGIINEPLLGIIGRDPLTRFYLKSYEMIRNISGTGNGAYMVIHDGFQSLGSWADFLPGSDRIVLDTHPYVAFGGGLNQPLNTWPLAACQGFQTNQSNIQFGLTITGEFSSAINDCGLWVKGVNVNPSYSNCTPWNDWETWTDEMKGGIKNFTMASMDAMHVPGYFYWTWKIGNSSATGKVESPFWSYQLGLENGWIPTDPRTAVGTCATLGYDNNQPFNGSYESWQTGGFGAGTIAATALASYSQYPPPAISNAGGANPLSLPQYTATSAVPSLAVPTFSGATASAGDGWADPSDTAMAAVQISGCIYPNAWGAPASSTAFLCGAAAQAVTATPAP
ncbi:hypothetical protein AcW2_006923 [Taiwanofungus camphoratus]|nr:hypothetical protein AcW2_006923 [Antrodia cinnamomea]